MAQRAKSPHYKIYRFLILLGVTGAIGVVQATALHQPAFSALAQAILSAVGGAFFYEVLQRNREKLLSRYAPKTGGSSDPAPLKEQR